MTFDEAHQIGDVGKKDFYFVEPAFTIGLGYKFLKLRYQYIIMNQLSSGEIKHMTEIGSLSLNLTFNINRLFTKKKNLPID